MLILLFGSIIAGREQRREWPTARADMQEELNLLLNEKDDEGTDAEVTRRKKCKKFCSVLVRNCLAVNGTLFVNGVDLTTLVRIAGLLGVLNTSQIERLVSALELLATPPVAPFAPGFPGVGGSLGWIYVFDTADSVVDDDTDVPFAVTGSSSPNMIHNAPEQITVVNSGIYRISFSVTTGTAGTNQFAVTSGDGVTQTVITDSIYGSGTEQNTGQVIVSLTAGNVVTLRNVSGSNLTLSNTVGGTTTPAVSASLLIERIA